MYRTYFHIGKSWGIEESTAFRIIQKIENILIKSRNFSLPGKKKLQQQDLRKASICRVRYASLTHPTHYMWCNCVSPEQTDYCLEVVVVDASESQIERQKKQYYSGKKKLHTLKAQLVVNQANGEIICTAYGKGKEHDFRLLKTSKVKLKPETEFLGDKGYQGIQKIHKLSRIPHKKPRGRQLDKTAVKENKDLAKVRIVCEHVIRRLKIFKIFAERYRNRRQRFGLRCNLIAGLCNYELKLLLKNKNYI